MKKKKQQTTRPAKIEVPFEVALLHIKPDELEKLKRYVAFYIAKYGIGDKAPLQESEGV